MDLSDVLRTTFSAREFTADPLPDADLYRLLDEARFAPSGGNRQGWHVVVVREAGTRRAIADLMAPAIRRYVAQVQAGESPWNTVRPTRVPQDVIDATPVPPRFTDPLLKAPVVLVVCVDLGLVASMDQYLDRVGVISGASVYPFVWSVLLAARNAGYGGVLTTIAVTDEPRLKALLGIPPEVAVAAVVPLGRPVRSLTRLRRKPVEAFTTRERWGGQALGPGA